MIGWFLAASSLQTAPNVTQVTTPVQLTAALKSSTRGQRIVLRDGNWNDVDLQIDKGGTATLPLTIAAQTSGKVHFQGKSRLKFNAPYVIVEGISFDHGGVTNGTVISFTSDHCTLRNSAVVDYNPQKFDDAAYWVMFEGSENTVSNCLFEGKNNMHPLVGNALDGAFRNSVRKSIFRNIPYVANANGREIMRIWGFGKDGTASIDGAFFTVEENLFDHADGEGQEIISLKSNHNVVRNNLIVASRGGITLRQGNSNVVDGNVILGKGIDRAYGVRITGRDQIVTNNYVEGCRYGMLLMCGGFTDRDLSGRSRTTKQLSGSKNAEPKYHQVQRLLLKGNRLVNNNRFDLNLSGDFLKNWPEEQSVLLPDKCRIEDNSIYSSRSHASVTGTDPELIKPYGLPIPKNDFVGNHLVGGTIELAEARKGFEALAYSRPPETGPWTDRVATAMKRIYGPDWLDNKASQK